ncbi:hypothetical protein, partial [Acinetobacter baumannii]|uniref:hypothetical protein n=1 Tax=Acinetobacter baumannii TaxID=470 RepID=UPI001C06B6A1
VTFAIASITSILMTENVHSIVAIISAKNCMLAPIALLSSIIKSTANVTASSPRVTTALVPRILVQNQQKLTNSYNHFMDFCTAKRRLLLSTLRL